MSFELGTNATVAASGPCRSPKNCGETPLCCGFDPLDPPLEIGRRDPAAVNGPSVSTRQLRGLGVGITAEFEGAVLPRTAIAVGHIGPIFAPIT